MVYWCIPQLATQEISYSLICGVNLMISIDIGEPFLYQHTFSVELNEQKLQNMLNLINKLQDKEKVTIRDM